MRPRLLQCDYIRPGFLRMATTPGHGKRLRHDLALLSSLGIAGFEWLAEDAAPARVDSELCLGAVWEPRPGLMNPARLARDEERLAEQLGARWLHIAARSSE